MKRLLLLALPALLLTGCDEFNRLPDQGSMVDPVRIYEVDAWGSNPDIIEFTPRGHSDKTCLILVSGGDTAAGLHCFDKK